MAAQFIGPPRGTPSVFASVSFVRRKYPTKTNTSPSPADLSASAKSFVACSEAF